MKMKIPAPISQVINCFNFEQFLNMIYIYLFKVVQGKNGVYQLLNIQKKTITVEDYKTMAESRAYKTPNHFDFAELERKYWQNITYQSPLYGADVSGSITDKDVHVCVQCI